MTDLGFFNVDKPPGMTSHDVVAIVRRGTQTKKVGHAGTLDPMATGVLVICWNKATRLSDYVMHGRKRYLATVHLGVETDTYDADGQVVATDERVVSRLDVEQQLPGFRGDIQQIPPMYSAIKRGGKKLYELARAGKEVERPPRAVTIDTLDIVKWDFPRFDVNVTCSSGTYIRSLAHDIGHALGVGAHLSALRRTAVSDAFTIDRAVTLDDLRTAFAANQWQQHLVDEALALHYIPYVSLSAQDADVIGRGGFVELELLDNGPIRAYNQHDQFIALLERRKSHSNVWKPLKVFV